MVITKKPATNQANTWEKELAEQAQAAVEQEKNTVGGQFFSTRGGLSFGGQTLPNNEAAVIILDGIMENVFYEGFFDANNPASPACFAFGRDEQTMAPHDLAAKKQCEQCKDCAKNAWKSAVKQDGSQGKGKACRNTRRLALIIAGNFLNGQFQQVNDPEHFQNAKIAYLKLPVTSVKAYAGYVKSVGGMTPPRPPHAVFTRIKWMPDPVNQFAIQFEPLAIVPNSLMQTVMDRHNEAMGEIDFPYQPSVEPAIPAATGKKTATPKKKY